MSVFGENAKIHPVTDMPLESGIGSLSPDQQALLHCDVIERTRGKKFADELRDKIRPPKVDPELVAALARAEAAEAELAALKLGQSTTEE